MSPFRPTQTLVNSVFWPLLTRVLIFSPFAPPHQLFFSIGTGKTTVAAAIGFGFVHQCRNISPNTKVLATAFSNVGADNLANALQSVGLKVVRLGKASAISENLWDVTLDAAIERDPRAQKAMERAAAATSQLSRKKDSKSSPASSGLSERTLREAATAAVKASNEVRRKETDSVGFVRTMILCFNECVLRLLVCLLNVHKSIASSFIHSHTNTHTGVAAVATIALALCRHVTLQQPRHCVRPMSSCRHQRELPIDGCWLPVAS